ncbi:leucine-rich repeat neuronal protein 3-like [Anopheles nili]|uniref:leucine-rich repeat neuronal protein 3-like n=1 Tax=Anopheles nili TaxID=185578 RepID=UPI00237C4AD5|nr:leucine-rich repeat neuronal protein 3-like [Anopheles nili]
MCAKVCPLSRWVIPLLLLLLVGLPVFHAQEDIQPAAPNVPERPISQLCDFKKPMYDPTDKDGDRFCDCDVHNEPYSGLPLIRIVCRRHGLNDSFWEESIREQLPHGTSQLDLSYNALTSVPRLSGDNLADLRLNHNKITTVPDNVFANVSTLVELRLSGNQLTVLTTDAFAGLTMLKLLDLSDNRISTIEVHAFSSSIHLERLILSNNSLGTLLNHTDSTLYLKLGVSTRLTVLELQRCNLTEVNLSAGVGLKRVLLGFNRFQTLTNLPKQVTYLDVSGTPIRTLTAKFLPHLLHLETLILQDMPTLYTLDDYALTGLPQLTTVNLQGSRNLSTVHPYVFGQNVARNETGIALSRFILKGTNLRTLNSTLLFAFQKLKVLDVRGAPLRCDCEVRWLREMPDLVTLAICARPMALHGKFFGHIKTELLQCRAEQLWIYTVFNVVLVVLLVVLVAVGIFLIVRAIRPKPHVQLRTVGPMSPYARVTIEPNREDML